MVQIRRKRRTSCKESIIRSIGGCLQFLAVSSVIPATFWARHYVFRKQQGDGNNNNVSHSTNGGGTILLKPNGDDKTGQEKPPPPQALSVVTDNVETMQMFDFLNQLDWTQPNFLLGSDVVELYHCQLQKLDMSNFTAWALPILNHTMTKAVDQVQKHNNYQGNAPTTDNHWQRIREEFVLELLEMRAQADHLCNYEMYRPALPFMEENDEIINNNKDFDPAVTTITTTTTSYQEQVTAALQALAQKEDNTQSTGSSSGVVDHKTTRVLFSIVAYRDIAHLRQLVEAIHMPQHYILIHMERRASAEWQAQIVELAASYENILWLKFGTVLYETDSVSMIHYRIMHWVIHELDLPFDFYASLDGASYPLFSPKDLAGRLVEAFDNDNREVWLGALLHKGVAVNDDRTSFLRNKRFLATRADLDQLPQNADTSTKMTVRMPRSVFRDQVFPDLILQHMTKKSNSGNQAVFSRQVVQDLVSSSAVRELFALSKYGCCCCLEEHVWIAAMGIIGRGVEALEQAAIWQVWGGTSSECVSSMKNAVLTRNATVCYKMEDASAAAVPDAITLKHGIYFYGNETWSYLQGARDRGVLFARKFDSETPASMALESDIRAYMWETEEGAPQ